LSPFLPVETTAISIAFSPFLTGAACAGSRAVAVRRTLHFDGQVRLAGKSQRLFPDNIFYCAARGHRHIN
jgi:hypothetical protein